MKRSNIADIYKKGQDLINIDRLDDALKIFIELSILDKKSSNIQLTISQIYKKKNDLVNSKIHLRKSLKINPNNAVALNNLGNIYVLQFDLINAEKYYLKSSDIDKKYSLPLFNLATLNQNKGNFEKAKYFYKRAIYLDNKNFEFIYQLNSLDSKAVTKLQAKFVEEELKKKNNYSHFNKASGYFFLAEKSKDEKNISREMENLSKAHWHFKHADNNLKKIINYWLTIIPKIKDKVVINKKNFHIPSINPIFISGLPRSGTTLIESIITSGEKDIMNGGETGVLNKSIILLKKNELFSNDYLKNNYKIEINFKEIEDQIIKLYKEQNLTKKIFTDKSLENIFFCDIIFELFPNAKIINCERSNFDNLVAIYQQYLPKMAWSHSIEDIIKYMENHINLSKHFKLKYPEKIFTIKLEEITNKPEEMSKQLMNFCNLEWNAKVLDFYKRKDLNTKTASNVQIRKKIYKYDSKKFETYRSYFVNYIKDAKINF